MVIVPFWGVVGCVCLTAISFYEPGSGRVVHPFGGVWRGVVSVVLSRSFFDLVWSSF